MKISTKGQYALEALIDLQLHAQGAQESLKAIAARRGISEPYLDQLFAALRKAGIVESIRGAQGGYRLAREPRAISSGDIIRAVEGPLYPVKCITSKKEDEDRCALLGICPTRLLWMRLAGEIDSVINGITLAELADSCKNRQERGIPEYSI